MEETNSTEKAIYSIVCVCLVLIGGVMSGLTLGLMSLDTVDLEVSYFTSQSRAQQQQGSHTVMFTIVDRLPCDVRVSMYVRSVGTAGVGEEWHPKREEVCKENTAGKHPQLNCCSTLSLYWEVRMQAKAQVHCLCRFCSHHTGLWSHCCSVMQLRSR